MALFFVGYLLAVSSTIAFIVAILTPKWIYPNSPTYPNATNYRGIFYVDQGRSDFICRDFILTYTDSVATCRPRTYKKTPFFVICEIISIDSITMKHLLI